jgi:hypothetical protein
MPEAPGIKLDPNNVGRCPMSNTFRVRGGSIAAGQSFRSDGWSWPDTKDRGVMFFRATPHSPFHDGTLVSTEYNKTFGGDGKFYYGFRITNEGPQDVQYDVEGGGL